MRQKTGKTFTDDHIEIMFSLHEVFEPIVKTFQWIFGKNSGWHVVYETNISKGLRKNENSFRLKYTVIVSMTINVY